MKNLSITCVIPFYNEADRIQSVLKQLIKVVMIKEIICVDDGSTDHASEKIAKIFPQIHILRLEKNVGKSAAVAAALREISSTYVLLFDADLRNFSTVQISQAISALDESIDMLIFAQARDPWFLKVLRFNILNSGERIIKTTLLKEIIATEKPKHYELEQTLNRWCYRNTLNVAWIPFSSDNYMKLEKWNKSSALTRSIQFLYLLLFTQSLYELIKIGQFFYPRQISTQSITK